MFQNIMKPIMMIFLFMTMDLLNSLFENQQVSMEYKMVIK